MGVVKQVSLSANLSLKEKKVPNMNIVLQFYNQVFLNSPTPSFEEFSINVIRNRPLARKKGSQVKRLNITPPKIPDYVESDYVNFLRK